MSTYKEFDHNFSLEGKTAVVTGGTSGIGKATARMLAEKGAKVIITGRQANVEQEAEKIAGSISGRRVELTDDEQVKHVVDEIESSYGNIDILCNVAGIGSGVPAKDITMEEFRNVLGVNLEAAFLMAQTVGKRMIASGRGGRIINVASDAGVVALKDHVAYSASKAGLLAITRTLALEWGQYGITCNAVSPTVVMTPMSREYWQGDRAKAKLERIPTGRFGEMDEVAAAIAFLASDGAQMINGHNLMVDGGATIC